MDYAIQHVSLSNTDRHNGLSMSDTIITFDLVIEDKTFYGIRLWANRIFESKIHLTILGHPDFDAYLKSLRKNVSRQLIDELRRRAQFIDIADDFFCHQIIGQTEFSATQMSMDLD